MTLIRVERIYCILIMDFLFIMGWIWEYEDVSIESFRFIHVILHLISYITIVLYSNTRSQCVYKAEIPNVMYISVKNTDLCKFTL